MTLRRMCGMRRGDGLPWRRWRSTMAAWRKSWSPRQRGALAAGAAVVLLLISFLVSSSLWPTARQFLPVRGSSLQSIMNPSPAPTRTGLSQWVGDQHTTTPKLRSFTASTATGSIIVDPLFQSYYTRHGGAAL